MSEIASVVPLAPAAEPIPTTAGAPPISDPKARLTDIARSLRAGEPVPPITVRAFLSWFWGTQRRGRWVVSHIRERLGEAGLRTVPDFESTYLDAEIAFEIAPEPTESSTGQPISGPAGTADHAETKVSPPAFTDPTYRISKLAAANRRPVSVTPDSSLTEAITLMMANDFSQLPVMVGERDVKGIVSWKSIGSRLALRQSPEHVRQAMDPHAEISSDASLFTAIPVIVENEYALVRAPDKRIVGVITTSDLRAC